MDLVNTDIKAATKRFFSKEPEDLSIAEASILAGSLKAPSRLSIINNKEASLSRARTVINLLTSNKLITEAQSKSAIVELESINRKNYYSDNGYRYYIDWLHSMTPDEILNNKKDLIVISTLDLKIQKILDNAVQDNIKNMDKKIQAAAVVMDYTGAVKAMLGGRNWQESKFNRATQSKRQIGSVFKSYVYLTAISMGYALSDKIEDTPIKKDNWTPKNFSDKYEGKINLLRAFAISSNVAAIRLSDIVGQENIIKQIKKLGIATEIQNNPSMALGTSSFSLIEVVGSFGAMCGNGIAVIPYGINKVKLRNDVEIWKRDSPTRKRSYT